jgi:DNA invertase Pin-like site-specific DNA recombinase
MAQNYLAYTRVSTAKQGEGVSLQEQKEAIQHYAERHNLTISDWYEEKETAAKRGRPVFGEMLKQLNGGEAIGVVIHKIDRSARNLKDWANLGDLIDAGIDVHFANESLDLNTRGGRLSADIQAVVAADYIRNLREETRKGFYGRLKQGFYPLRAPLGYLDNGGGVPKTIDPVMGPLIRQAFELYASGGSGLNALVVELARRGLRNHSGRTVTRNGLSTILNNPFYFGLIHLRRSGESYDGVHEPIISKVLFDRVQRVLRGKTKKGPGLHAFLFRRLFLCESCGYSIIGERQRGHVYYRCHTKDCATLGFREEVLEEAIRERLQPLRLTHPEMRYLLKKVEELRGQWKERAEEQEKALRFQRAKIQDRLTGLTDAFLDGLIEKELLEERKGSLLAERRDLDNRLARREGASRSIPDKVQEFLELADSVDYSYETGNPEEKRDLIRIVTSNRAVRGRKLEITLKQPFRLIAERPPVTNSRPSRARHRILDALLAALGKYFEENELVIPEERP